MSRTIATSQSREPPSTDAVPDRPPPTSGGPSRISADGVTSPSPRLGFATTGRDTLGSALAGEGPSCSVGERRWNDRESDLQVHRGRSPSRAADWWAGPRSRPYNEPASTPASAPLAAAREVLTRVVYAQAATDTSAACNRHDRSQPRSGAG